MNKCILTIMVVVMGAVGSAEGNWVTLDYPGAVRTEAWDIDGSKIVGTCDDISPDYQEIHGFLYDGATWTAVPPSEHSSAHGIGGDKIVGVTYYSGGGPGCGDPTCVLRVPFVYGDGGTVTFPFGSPANVFTDIDGDRIVGFASSKSYLYDGTTWTELEFPESSLTHVFGIDGEKVVGLYSDVSGERGFLYDGTTWTSLDFPDALTTYAYGIEGDRIVGEYSDTSGHHGFLYDGVNWFTLDFPGATWTWAGGIDGDNIVGGYNDASGNGHGFIYTIPEPTTLLLLGAGGIAVLRRRRQ